MASGTGTLATRIIPLQRSSILVYRHLISTEQLSRDSIESELWPLVEKLRRREGSVPRLSGKALYCLFYEPSFLTRASFERAIGMLGGEAYHTEDASQFYPVSTPYHIENIINILASLQVDVVVLRSSEPSVVVRAMNADAVPVINGGSLDDHPTQALADVCTLNRELGGIDGMMVAIVGRLEHRNVSAFLKVLTLFDEVKVTLVPFSGQADPDVVSYCEERGVTFTTATEIESVRDADAIYLNGPRTVAHVQLLKLRNAFNLQIDEEFMSGLRPHCVILDPMQRSGDFTIAVEDRRLAFYRQAENALYVRMAVLSQMLSG